MTKQRISSEFLDRRPPSASEAELGVLGSLWQDPSCADDVAAIVSADDFYEETNKTFFRLIMAALDDGQPIDTLTIKALAKATGVWVSIGGAEYLAKIATAVPYAANAAYYARIVAEKAGKRRLRDLGESLILSAHDDTASVADVLTETEHTLDNIGGNEHGSDIVDWQTVLPETVSLLERLKEQGKRRGLPTGLADFDAALGGLHNGELVIMAARPRMGKTSLAVQIAKHNAKRGRRVMVVSLEMSAIELTTKMLCGQAGVDANRTRTGRLDDDDMAALSDAAQSLFTATMTIIDRPAGMTVAEIRRVARQVQKRDGLELLVIDYLQLLNADDPRAPRQEQVAAMARRLKGLARELDVPVLVLAQLNRQAESKGTNRPQLSHLRESGAIEQDADVVMFIHREEVYRPDDDDVRGKADLFVAKNRNGPARDFQLEFDAATTTFRTPATRWSEFDEHSGGDF